LQEVSSMSDLLGLNKLTPKKMVWEDKLYLGRGTSIPVPVDYVYASGKKVILAARMREVLTPVEWKPLIGSSLVMRSWAKPRYVKTLVGAIVITAAIYVPILLLAALTSLLGTAGKYLIFPPIYILIGVALLALLGRYYSPAAHEEALKADRQVAGILGLDTFLATLVKIDNIGFSDVEKLNMKSSKFQQPSIRERIQNLQSG